MDADPGPSKVYCTWLNCPGYDDSVKLLRCKRIKGRFGGKAPVYCNAANAVHHMWACDYLGEDEGLVNADNLGDRSYWCFSCYRAVS